MVRGARVAVRESAHRAAGQRTNSRGTTVSIGDPRIACDVRRRRNGELRRVRVGGGRSKERWGEITASRSNESARLYLYRVFVKGYSVVRRAPVDTHGRATRHDTRDRMRTNNQRQALADNAQLLITLDLAALLASVVRWESPSIGGARASPDEAATFVIVTDQIGAPCVTMRCQASHR